MIVTFKPMYMIDDVENLFDYYLHITYYVLYTLASCTHYTVINAKFCTYDCFFNLVIFNCIWFDVNAKFFVLVGNLKIRFSCFRSLTSWLVLIFAFKRHHVFKTFLDHVHIHWVLKTSFQVFFLHKFSKFLKF